MNKLVSVLIPSYNHEKYVQESIKSIINQTYENIELIIIDDGSKDSTFEKIQEMESDCKGRFSRVVIQKQENQGTSKTLKSLHNLAKGDYVFILASDDIVKSQTIEKEVKFLNENPDYVLAVGDNEFIDDNSDKVYWDDTKNLQKSESKAVYKTFSAFLQVISKINFNSDDFGNHFTLLNRNHIPNGYTIRKSVLDKIKDNIFLEEAQLEDYNLVLQLSKYGKFKYFNEILFSYRCHESNSIKNTELMMNYTFKTMLFNKELSQKENYDSYSDGVKKVFTNPKVSILCVAYNHQNFITSLINSIRINTFYDFEVIIINDNSTDKTCTSAEKLPDPRVKIINNSNNIGLASSINKGFEEAKGEYCVLISADDMLDKIYLATASKYLDENQNADAFCCCAQLINEQNQSVSDPQNLFYRNNAERNVVLNTMFLNDYNLISEGIMIRKSAFEKILPLPSSPFQTLGKIIQLKLLFNGNIYQASQKLVLHRVNSNGSNFDSPTPKNQARAAVEENFYMETFLEFKDLELFKKTFPTVSSIIGEPQKETMPFVLGRLALYSPKIERKMWGYNKIMEFYSSKKNQELLHKLYNFTFSDYLKLIEIFN